MQQQLIEFYDQWQQLVAIAFVLLGTLVVALVVRYLLRKFRKRPGATGYLWRNAILGAMNAPVRWLVWVIGLSVAEARLTRGGDMPVLANVFAPVRDVVIVGLVAWFLIRMIRRVTDVLALRAKLGRTSFDQTAADAMGKLLVATVAVIAAMAIMQTLGFSLASLLTFGGVAGIALGFAAQGLVSNLLGGITIYASRPFRVGDHIVFSGESLMAKAGYIGWQAGEVQHIGWRATRILDWNGKPFYVPNAKFNTETVINHSRMDYREISEYMYIRLEDVDKVAAIATDVNRMLAEHAKIDDYFVFQLDGYGDYALRLYLYAYTISTVKNYTDFLPVKQDVLLKIADSIASHGAKLAVPVSTVYLPDGQPRPAGAPYDGDRPSAPDMATIDGEPGANRP